MKEVIVVKKKNQSQLKIEVNDYNILRELTRYFSAKVHGYKFMPAYKMGAWNGTIYFFKDQLLPIGLLTKLYKFAESGDYVIKKEFDDIFPLKEDDLWQFIKNLELPPHLEVRDYQFKSAYDALCNKRLSIKANTAAGKSLIMYIIIRFMLAADKRVLLVVPQTHLVGQMYTDWEDYGWNDIGDYVEQVYGGMPKTFARPVIISTWQSMFEKKKVGKKLVTRLRNSELFNSFECLMMDEAHSCFHSETKIKMSDNSYKKIIDVSVGDKIISYNEIKNKFEYDVVYKVYRNLSKSEDMYELELENGEILKVTGNHKLLTKNRGWVEVKNLNISDDLMEF